MAQASIEELRRGYLFAELTEQQVERIARHAVKVRLAEGDPLFEQGDPAKRFYLVTAGQIKLFRLSPAGNEKVIDIVTPGQSFAEALVFLESPHYPVGAQALQPSAVISIDSQDFASMLRGSIDTCFMVMGSMTQRLRALLREIDELSLHSATCRVAAYLLQHASDDGDTFALPVAKQIIASRLSVKPETFSRIIKNLSGDGLIRIDRDLVSILDRDGLEDAADTCGLPDY